MQHRAAHRALSVFLAIVMVLTCNSATFQPLAAYADEEASQTSSPELSQEEAVIDESAEASADEGESLPHESGQEETAGVPDEPPASNAVSQTSREVVDMTEAVEAVLLDLLAAVHVDADRTEHKVDAVGVRYRPQRP